MEADEKTGKFKNCLSSSDVEFEEVPSITNYYFNEEHYGPVDFEIHCKIKELEMHSCRSEFKAMSGYVEKIKRGENIEEG